MMAKRRRRVYLFINIETRKNDTACDKQQQQRRMKDAADTLVPPSLCLSSISTCSAAWALRVSASARFFLRNSSANSAATSFLNSSSNLSDDRLCCSALVRLVVELRLPQRIKKRPRNGLASRLCSATAMLDSHHVARESQRPISANGLLVRATSSSLAMCYIFRAALFAFFFLFRLLCTSVIGRFI